MLPSIRSSPTNGRTDSYSFSILPSTRNLFILGDFNRHTSSETQKVLLIPIGWKYLIALSLLTSSPSMTLTYLLFFIAPPLTSPLLPPLSPSPAPGRCFSTWVLIIHQFYSPSLFLQSFAPTNVSLPSIFRTVVDRLCFLLRFSLSFSRGILVSFSFLCCCSLYFSDTECSQIFHPFRPHQTPS